MLTPAQMQAMNQAMQTGSTLEMKLSKEEGGLLGALCWYSSVGKNF